MDPELRGRVKRLAKAADRHDMIMLTADQRCLARDTADLLHAYDALRAENEKLRDAMRDMDAENRTLRTGNYASVYAEDLRKHAAERKRSAKLVEAAERDELAHAHHVTRLVEAINSYHVLARTDDRAERIRRANEVVESLNRKRDIPDIETLAASVHRAYCENHIQRKGEPYWTGGDYSLLDEATKEIDRATVRAVLAALATYRHSNEPAKEEG